MLFITMLHAAKINRLSSYRSRQRSGWSVVALFIVIAALGVRVLISHSGDMLTWIDSPDGKAAYGFWIGTKSVFDLVTGVMTVVIAIVAALLAHRSYRVNQRAAVANRYQKGVELLGASTDSSKLGGIELLSVVAREAHKEYQEPVIRTLRQFLQERCSETVEAIYSESADNVPEAGASVDLVVMAALSAVARTDGRQRWLELEHDDEGLLLLGICLHRTRFFRYDFSRITFGGAVFGDVWFEFCRFEETVIDARCLGTIRFINCSFRNVEISAFDVNGERVADVKEVINISKNCKIACLRINGRPVSSKA